MESHGSRPWEAWKLTWEQCCLTLKKERRDKLSGEEGEEGEDTPTLTPSLLLSFQEFLHQQMTEGTQHVGEVHERMCAEWTELLRVHATILSSSWMQMPFHGELFVSIWIGFMLDGFVNCPDEKRWTDVGLPSVMEYIQLIWPQGICYPGNSCLDAASYCVPSNANQENVNPQPMPTMHAIWRLVKVFLDWAQRSTVSIMQKKYKVKNLSSKCFEASISRNQLQARVKDALRCLFALWSIPEEKMDEIKGWVSPARFPLYDELFKEVAAWFQHVVEKQDEKTVQFLHECLLGACKLELLEASKDRWTTVTGCLVMTLCVATALAASTSLDRKVLHDQVVEFAVTVCLHGHLLEHVQELALNESMSSDPIPVFVVLGHCLSRVTSLSCSNTTEVRLHRSYVLVVVQVYAIMFGGILGLISISQGSSKGSAMVQEVTKETTQWIQSTFFSFDEQQRIIHAIGDIIVRELSWSTLPIAQIIQASARRFTCSIRTNTNLTLSFMKSQHLLPTEPFDVATGYRKEGYPLKWDEFKAMVAEVEAQDFLLPVHICKRLAEVQGNASVLLLQVITSCENTDDDIHAIAFEVISTLAFACDMTSVAFISLLTRLRKKFGLGLVDDQPSQKQTHPQPQRTSPSQLNLFTFALLHLQRSWDCTSSKRFRSSADHDNNTRISNLPPTIIDPCFDFLWAKREFFLVRCLENSKVLVSTHHFMQLEAFLVKHVSFGLNSLFTPLNDCAHRLMRTFFIIGLERWKILQRRETMDQKRYMKQMPPTMAELCAFATLFAESVQKFPSTTPWNQVMRTFALLLHQIRMATKEDIDFDSDLDILHESFVHSVVLDCFKITMQHLHHIIESLDAEMPLHEGFLHQAFPMFFHCLTILPMKMLPTFMQDLGVLMQAFAVYQPVDRLLTSLYYIISIKCEAERRGWLLEKYYVLVKVICSPSKDTSSYSSKSQL